MAICIDHFTFNI